jgi:hypothetical protein
VNWKSKKFLLLQEKWYRKLRESGWVDIEKNNFLINYHSMKLSRECTYNSRANRGEVSRATRAYQESRRQYYRIAAQFLYSHKFQHPLHKRIWQLHVNGVSQRDIAKIIPELTLKKSRFIAECLRDEMLKRGNQKLRKSRRKYT